jgi:anti-anti-sigma regulatory factor
MRQGGNLKLAETPHRLRGILAVTNLTQVFDLFESEQAAIDSFQV